MTRDPRYDILFEPVQIGPVTAKNRFYQVPHCGGMGFNWPQTDAKMREMKAEGGWAVVCTEDRTIHPSSDYSPSPQARLWDGYDVECLALLTDAIHRHDALAGVELTHNGVGCQNLYTRFKPLGPSPQAGVIGVPTQSRGMDKADIREFRRRHRNAVLRAREAVGDRCAIAIRLAVDELLGDGGIRSVQAIGDCEAPATIALAVYDGHRAARELDAPPRDPDLPFRREEVALDAVV